MSARHLGVALSGGGHRASVWAAGALLYLADSGRSRDVVAVSSVSGGSITNGVLAARVDLSTAGPDELAAGLRPLLRHVADEGLFPLARATRRYVLAVAVLAGLGLLLLLAGLVVMAVTGLGAVSGGLLAAGLLGLVLGARLFSRRSEVVDAALARTHFSRDGRPLRLADVARPVDHVFCATELQSGDHVYLSPRFVYGYQFGSGAPGGLPLSTAVQASACLPGAFAPRRLAVSDLIDDPRPGRDDELVLVDGGVYDNMADQWLGGLPARLRRLPDLPVQGRDVDEVVVVNASAPAAWKQSRRSRWVLVGELLTLKRVDSVMYQVTTERRRTALVDAWTAAEQLRRGQVGALVHIAQTPYTVADAFARSDDRSRAARARRVLALLGDDPESRARWTRTSEAARGVPTVLRRLGRETTLDLLEHAYVLSMCNLHVVLGHPLLELPTRARLVALLEPVAAASPRAVDLRSAQEARTPTSGAAAP